MKDAKIVTELTSKVGEMIADIFSISYDAGYKDAKAEFEIYTENGDYKSGIIAGWEAYKKIYNMSPIDTEKYFGTRFKDDITPLDAVAYFNRMDNAKNTDEVEGVKNNIETMLKDNGLSLEQLLEVLNNMRKTK